MPIFSKLAKVKAPRFIHHIIDAVEATADHVAQSAKVDAAEAVGYAELAGFRYPVKAYHFQVSPTLTRGSRLDEKGLADLAKRGFKGVVNLCKEYDDSDKVRAAGLRPLHLAIIDNTKPTEEQMYQFLDFAKDAANQQTYVHCEAGMGRTGVAVACYRMAVQGWTDDQAIDDGKKFGLQLANQIEFLHQFYNDLKGKGPIPIGSVIAPPKKSSRVSLDAKGEKAWWDRLEKTEISALQPGDIVLRKTYEGSSLVVTGQKGFQAQKGTKFSSHVMLALGGGKFAHAFEVPMATVISESPGGYWIVYRAVDKAHAEAAAKTADWLVRTGAMKYSVADCLDVIGGDHSFGPNAKWRADLVAAHKVPTDRTMCSEFVCYCYQSFQNDPHIKMDAKRVAPMRLEDYLNHHPEMFRFAGAVHDGPEKDPGGMELFKKAAGNLAGEIGENTKAAADEASA